MKSVMTVGNESHQVGRLRSGSRIASLELVANRPIVQHALDWVLEADDAGIVFVGEADALFDVRESIGHYARWFKEIDYVVCPLTAGIPAVLRAVAPYVGDAACVLQPADGLLDEPLEPLVSMLDAADLVLLTGAAQKVDSKLLLGQTTGDTFGLGSDPVALDEASERLVEVGFFAPGALELAAASVEYASRVDLGFVGQHVEGGGSVVKWRKCDRWHRYRAHGPDLLDLNRITLDRLIGSVIPEQMVHNNSIEGKVQIDPSALISGSTIAGPVVIGPDAVVANSYVGPYTSIGPGARIVGAEVERSIVSSGASVLHIGSRLVTSLVGRDTRVFTDFSLPRGLRLWVGDGEDLAIC